MRDFIRFCVNGEMFSEHHIDPSMSLLAYLRERKGLTGSKEGCNEGDCGACTVVLGELVDGRVCYRAVNACLLFMGAVDGKIITTVEGLGTPDTPHEIQSLISEKHGSQCGFCTPGFVMSLYGLSLSDLPHEQSNIEEALAGNLCRCTGYGPLIESAKAMPKSAKNRDDLSNLKAMAHDEMVELTAHIHGQARQFFIPKTLEELSGLLAKYKDATLLAGGTDIGLWVNKQHRELPVIIYLGGVEELGRLEETEESLRIGAGVRYAEALPYLGRFYPDMETVMRRIGATQVRNLGTLGGNIANGSPIGDMPPMLIAAAGKLVLQNSDKTRTIDLEDFFIDYGQQDLRVGEFVRDIIVPKPGPDQHFYSYKISKRFDSDITAVLLAISFELVAGMTRNVRIACGGMAATPKRAKAAEVALEGQPWSEDNIRQAMEALGQDFQPISDMRASQNYRMRVAQNLLYKAWLEHESGPQSVLEVVP